MALSQHWPRHSPHAEAQDHELRAAIRWAFNGMLRQVNWFKSKLWREYR